VVNFALGANNASVSVTGNLSLDSTLNVSDDGGFGPNTYTLFSYTGSLGGTPVLGAKPAGFNCSLSTATAGQVNLIVTSTNTSGTAPVITNDPPASLFVSPGGNVSLTAGASGTAPLSWQWWFNVTNHPAGGGNPALNLTNVQPAQAGAYFAVVTNAYGSATSSVVTLTLLTPPAFSVAQTIQSGGGLVLSGGGGAANAPYRMLASTNVFLPTDRWLPVATNHFDAAGNFSFTNAPGLNPDTFYILVSP
jgi:hypothetical protein